MNTVSPFTYHLEHNDKKKSSNELQVLAFHTLLPYYTTEGRNLTSTFLHTNHAIKPGLTTAWDVSPHYGDLH